MPNPFVYGEVVPLSAFADRVDELEQLVADLGNAQKVFLISPRRYGKSSLIRRALVSLERRGKLTVDVTVASYSSYLAFLEGYARAIASVQTPWDKARAWLRETLGANRAEIRVDPDPGGRLSVAFPSATTARDVERLAPDVFALPARLAHARGRGVVVALDEFQAIAGFDGGTVEQALRAAIQTQREVGYVFAGSEPSLMERMLGPRRPFYKAGPVMRLGRIPPAEFAEFVESRFTPSGIRPEPGLGSAIVDLAGNMPYDVQRLAHETWDDVKADGRKRATEEDLHRTLKRLLAQNDTMFENLWQRLTLVQRATLRAVVVTDGRALLSAEVRSRHRLGGTSTVQAALAALTREDVIAREEDRYLVNDSLFREWIARKTF
ncbi:MAG: AAA family ATPase [Acidobacteriota bacterium]